MNFQQRARLDGYRAQHLRSDLEGLRKAREGASGSSGSNASTWLERALFFGDIAVWNGRSGTGSAQGRGERLVRDAGSGPEQGPDLPGSSLHSPQGLQFCPDIVTQRVVGVAVVATGAGESFVAAGAIVEVEAAAAGTAAGSWGPWPLRPALGRALRLAAPRSVYVQREGVGWDRQTCGLTPNQARPMLGGGRRRKG